MRCAISGSNRQKRQRHTAYDSIGLNRSRAQLWELNAARLSSGTRAAEQRAGVNAKRGQPMRSVDG